MASGQLHDTATCCTDLMDIRTGHIPVSGKTRTGPCKKQTDLHAARQTLEDYRKQCTGQDTARLAAPDAVNGKPGTTFATHL
jgi:hypothetical protein